LVFAGKVENLLVGVAGSGEEFFSPGPRDRQGNLLSNLFLQRGIGQKEGALGSAPTARTTGGTSSATGGGSGRLPAWRCLSVCAHGGARIHNRRDTDRARGAQRIPTFGARSGMRLEGAGRVDRSGRIDVNGDLAF